MDNARSITRTESTLGPAAGVVATVVGAILLTGAVSTSVTAQSESARGEAGLVVEAPGTAAAWHYPVGETAVYDVRVGMGRVSAPRPLGEARLSVEAREPVDGVQAYRLALEIQGGVSMLYRQDDRQVSWVATDPLRTLRFEEHLRQGDYRRDRLCRMEQEEHTYSCFAQGPEGAWEPVERLQGQPMPARALDEVSILYLVRSLPLEVGKTYRFERLFEKDSNPVRIQVLRRETVRVPAGRFETIVVRPIFESGGMFGEGGRAEVYLSDDARRKIVKIESSMKLGRIDLLLKEYRAPGRGHPTDG